MLGCEPRSRGVHGSLADRRAEAEKKITYVTTRGCNFGDFNGLGHDFSLLTAHLLCLGVLCYDIVMLATFSLAPRCLPASDLPLAFRVLAVALVPATWLVLASAAPAQADPGARSSRSGQTAVSVSNVDGAHGSRNSQGKARGECWSHSPRALPKLEKDANPPVYRLLENKTAKQTISETCREQEPRRCSSKDRKRCRFRVLPHFW